MTSTWMLRRWWPAAGAAVVALAAVALTLVPALLYPPLSQRDLRGVTDPRARIELQQAQSKLATEARAAVLQAIAGLLVAVGAAATWRQVRISREGQLTDRFGRAVEQLGSANPNVRVGGIYALERISRNSPDDRHHIQYLLSSFVRQQASLAATTGAAPVDTALPWMRVRAPDVQAAMGVLGRRPPDRRQPVLYLSRMDLRSVALNDANLTGAKLRHANLARAVLIGARLDAADLTGADLRSAHLEGASLTGADLTGALLDGAVLLRARADPATRWPAGYDPDRLGKLGVIVA
ncbi:pentapeptide repeat-containing protein [Actinoplanes sp. N902-109]|uniref:pentapeptide repeat-containing protein n=1 Tax=Actinoplanes sp. (strain N902-109) TaxID=649831 RepID=UPI0012F7CB19|nr:pentapeptide repeat-containing protein [Actinoplanes sp. N902-109]